MWASFLDLWTGTTMKQISWPWLAAGSFGAALFTAMFDEATQAVVTVTLLALLAIVYERARRRKRHTAPAETEQEGGPDEAC